MGNYGTEKQVFWRKGMDNFLLKTLNQISIDVMNAEFGDLPLEKQNWYFKNMIFALSFNWQRQDLIETADRI